MRGMPLGPSRPARALAVSLALAASLAAPLGYAQKPKKEAVSKARCIESFEKAQVAKKATRYAEARAKALECSNAACPAAVRGDCAELLRDVEALSPSVVFEVLDGEGRELVDVRVSLDGEPLAERVDAKAVPVDPGEHTFRFEGAPGATTVKVLVREGEKAKKVSARLGAPKTPDPTPPAPVEASSTGPSPAAWVLGGVGLVGLGLFAGLGGAGLAEKGELEASCGKTPAGCTPAQLDSVKTKFLVADVSLAAGGVSLVVATVLFVVTPKKAATALRGLTFGATPVEGGGLGALGGRF